MSRLVYTSVICFLLLSGPAFSQSFGGSGFVTTDPGVITAMRVVGRGDVLVTINGVNPALFNPANCSNTSAGFRVSLAPLFSSGSRDLAAGAQADLPSLFNTLATSGTSISLNVGQTSGCDGRGRPIAIAFEIVYP